MSELKVIAFVGMPGSGKGTCTDYLHISRSWPVVHFGNMVYEEVQRRGLDNVKDEAFVRKDMRDQDGPAVLAKHVARKVEEYAEKGEEVVVLDGLYSWSEYKFLTEKFGEHITVIAVAAPRKVRHDRVVNRKDSHRTYTHEQIHARDYSEIETLEKGGPIANADYTLVNDGDKDGLLHGLDQVLAFAGIE
jgi:dephospho-CoA kinase